MPKFDVVIGNPPYLNGLHLKFLNIAIDMSKEHVAFIEPAGWLLNEKDVKRKNVEVEIKEKVKDISFKVDLYNGAVFFPEVCIGTYIGVFYVNKLGKKLIIINNTMTQETFKFKDLSEISKHGNSETYKNLKSKILNAAKESNLENFRNKNIDKNYINFSGIRGNISTHPNKIWKDDFYTIVTKTLIVSKKSSKLDFLSFKTKEEAENCLQYLKTDFARFALSIYKLNWHNNSGELCSVPYLDFTQSWTDEKLYKQFNLTKEEIKFIQKNIPKYYDK